MTISISNDIYGLSGPVSPRRLELEEQLAQAIRQAERRYRMSQAQTSAAPPAPTANPPHLGLKVDIRV